MATSQTKGTALVTGASSGVGAVYADRLAKQGYDLILVARNEARLRKAAERITRETGRNVRVVAADLNDRKDLLGVEQVLKTDGGIALLVNNAGVGAVTPLLGSDIGKMEEMIALNVGALTRLTYAAAPAFVSRGHGTIINIASVVALNPERLNGVYGATKAYVLAFTQSLQHELADQGVRIQAVLPGATVTEIWERAGFPIENLSKDILMRAEDMVDASLAGLDQGEVVTIPALPDANEWNAYEAARNAMAPRLSNRHPAARYTVGAREVA